MKKILVCVLVLVMCITAFVACNPTDDTTPDLSGLNSAKAYLQNQYRDEATNTLGDFERLATLKVGTATFTVEWTASVTSGPQTITIVDNEDGTVTIDIEEVDETVTEDTLYTLTATITDANGNSTTVTYNHMIPKFAVNTFAEYVAAEAGESIIIDGIVTGILPKGNGATNDGFYMNTLDGGGVYVYQTSGAELTVGQTIRVKGTKDVYNGTHELKDSTYEVIDANVTTVTPVDYTEIYTNAEDLKDEALVEKQALLVTIKGVTIGTVGGSDGSYYYFELAGKKSYIRISSSSCPMTTAEQTAFKAAFNANFGATADVTGLITIYSGAFYLTPVSANAISNIAAPELTDQQVVDGAKEALTIVDTIKEAGTVELPTAGTGIYSDAAITWALSTTTVATLEGNVLTVAELPKDESTITLTATIAKGDATAATKGFTVTVKSAVIDWKSVADAVELCEALDGASKETSKDEYYFYGFVGTTPTADYCNFDLVDENGNKILVYGLYAPNGEDRYGTNRDIAEIPFKVGDLICMRGKLQNYNGKLEIVYAVEVETPEKGSAICNPLTATEAAAICGQLDGTSKETSKDEYFFLGTVDDIYNTQYCNFHFVDDAEGDLVVYGLYAPNGEDRYGSNREIAEIPFKEGDTILLRGKLQNYNGTLQISGAVLISFSTPAGGETPDPDPTPAEKVTTIADALKAAVGTEAELQGTVVGLGTWNTQYNNWDVTISDGTNLLLVYRCTNSELGIGDVVSVVGTIGAYNNVNQIAQGSTVTVVTAHVCTFDPADCDTPATCPVCEKTDGEALGHVDENPADGTCDRCQANLQQASSQVTASKTIAELITSEGWDGNTTKQSFKLDENVTVKIDGGNNTGKAYNGDHIRIYATDSPAGTITISVPEGYELVSVKITAQVGTYAFLYLGEGTTDICNVETAVSGQSVVLNSVKNGDNGKQVRVTAIEVVYRPVQA